MDNWSKVLDPWIEGEALTQGNKTVEVIRFKEYGDTYVVYGWEDKKYKGARGYTGETLAKEMALEWLNGNKEVLEWYK